MKIGVAVAVLIALVYLGTDTFLLAKPPTTVADAPADPDPRAGRCGSESFGSGWMRGDDSGTLVAITGDAHRLGANELLADDSPLVDGRQQGGLMCIHLSAGKTVDCGHYGTTHLGGLSIVDAETSALVVPVRVQYRFFQGDATVASLSWTSSVENGCPRQLKSDEAIVVSSVVKNTHELRREALGELRSLS